MYACGLRISEATTLEVQVVQQPLQPFERDRLAETQIKHEGPQVRAKGRARLQPAGAGALKRWAQQGQVPPNSVTRVTSGVISGISMRS